MKLLGLCCGRRMGNSEILLKEALMGAEELGVEMEIVRLMDLKIKPCTGCSACMKSFQKGGSGKCVIKGDDMPFFNEKLMECDGLIVSVPVYILSPPGYFKVLCDRVGPSHDVAFLSEAKKMGAKGIDERFFKTRVGGFIAVGGNPRHKWVCLGLPLMHCLTLPMNIEIVDQLQVLGAELPGQVVLNEEAMKRARRLGRNVGEALGKPVSGVKFMGDEPGTCPVCHMNLLLVGKKATVECAICGIEGTLKVERGEVTVIFGEEEQKKSRLTLEASRLHFHEIWEHTKEELAKHHLVPKELEKYKSYGSYSLPPRKRAKGSGVTKGNEGR